MTSVCVTHPANRIDTYFGARAIAALRAIAEVRVNPQPRDLSTCELIELAQDCDALIAYRQTPAPDALFRGLPSLKAFIRCAMDISTVDVGSANAHGVLVTRASAGFAPAVAEWTMAVMAALGRGIQEHAEAYHRGDVPVPAMGRELRGATLGIVGFGRIGRCLGELALAFGMHVEACALHPIDTPAGIREVTQAQLLAHADFVVCLAPATDQTRNLFNAAAFAAMRRGAYFVNAARGELVDDAALLDALQSGHVAGCALDVGRMPDQMPTAELARHPRVIATPHIGGLTQPAIDHQALETVAQCQAIVEGRIPDGAVNAGHATRLARWWQQGAEHRATSSGLVR